MADDDHANSAISSTNSSSGGGGFFSHFSSRWSKFVGKSVDGAHPEEQEHLDVAAATSISSMNHPHSHRRDSGRGGGRKSSQRSSAASSTVSTWSWRRRFSRPSIGGTAAIVAEKLTSASNISTHSSALTQCSSAGGGFTMIPHSHQHQLSAVSGVCSTCEQFKLSTSLKERVIVPKKVPDFLIPAMSASDRQRLIGGSWSNLRSSSSVNNNSNTGGNKGQQTMVESIDRANVPSSSSFYGGLTSSGTISNELGSADRDRQGIRMAEQKSPFWRHGSIPSSLDNLIYGTLQTNELIKRSSTELINDLVKIIAPESGRRSQTAITAGIDIFGLPSPKTVRHSGIGDASCNGDLLKMTAESGNSSTSVAGRTSGQWDCYHRCITSVRFQLVEHQRRCTLTVFLRRLHNSPLAANFYSSLKSSVMQWKVRLIVATKSCKILIKKKYTINGPMPLEEQELFTGIRLPRLSSLLNHSCCIWLRLQLCHRPVDDDDDDDDQEDNGLWQRNSRNRRSYQKTPAARRTATRMQRFPPFLVFVHNLLTQLTPDWCSDVECPSVKLIRREKQQQLQIQQSIQDSMVHSRSFAAFPCCYNSAAAFDKTLLSSKSDKRNMVVALLSFTCYVFASSPVDINEPRNIVFDFKEVRWKKPGIILAKFLGMTTSRIWTKSDVAWCVRSVAKRGAVKSMTIRLSGRTINANHVIASIELSEASEDYMAAQLFHTVFRHVYFDEHYNRPAETLSKPLLLLAGDGDENSNSIRKCFSIETVLPLVAVS